MTPHSHRQNGRCFNGLIKAILRADPEAAGDYPQKRCKKPEAWAGSERLPARRSVFG